ncbi:MAG: tetratricopeptide repeat protein, partial [Betaproteobacteria bacterium]|nr:tetratricopeptide repeat protein [Betaproteobacteria bacterium]
APLARQAAADTPPKVAAVTESQPSQQSRDDAEQQARWFYSTLTGEIAARTGHPDVAYTELLRAARDMNSAPLFERVVQVALAAHHPDQALAAVGVWRDLEPVSVRAQVWRVQLLLGMGRDAEGASAISRLLSMTPQAQRPEAILSLGGMFEGMSDPARALALARRSLAPYASLPQSQVVTALMRVRAGQVSAGVAQAARALQAEPTLRAAAMLLLQHYKVDPSRADRSLAGYFAARPDDDSLRMIWIDVATAQQRASVALAQCEVLARHRPEMAQVWLIMGSLRQQLDQQRQAEQDLARFLGLSLAPGNAADATVRGLLAQLAVPAPGAAASAPRPPASVQPPAAAPSAPATVSSEPGPEAPPGLSQQDLERIYLALSGAALKQGALERSGQWLRLVPQSRRDAAVVLQRAKLRAAQGHPAQAVALVRELPRGGSGERRERLLAMAELLQYLHEPGRAYAVLESGMHAWGRQPDYAYETAMAAEQAGRPARMVTLLRRIVQAHADFQPALNALGYMLADQGRDLEQARALVLRALRLTPGNPFVLDSLGWVEFRLGRLARAQSLLEQAYEGRNDPAIAAHLSEVLWRRGQRPRATALLREAWQASPQDPGVLAAMRRLGLKF